MIRLFVSNELGMGADVALDEKACHYLLNVMRQKSGDKILCFNGRSGEWLAEIQLQGKKKASLHLLEQTRAQETPDFCAICPALIKKDNFDFVLQKATELGVTDIFPLLTDHTVHPRLNQAHAEAICTEAAEQSERLTLPIVHTPCRIADLPSKLPADCGYFYLSERESGDKNPRLPKKAAFLVGPEGGWSEKEKDFFKVHSNFIPLHFEGGILRAETASVAILACWQCGRQLNWKK